MPARSSTIAVVLVAALVAAGAAMFFVHGRGDRASDDVAEGDRAAFAPPVALAAKPRAAIAPSDVPVPSRATITGTVRVDGKPVVATVAAYVEKAAAAHESLAWARDAPPAVPLPATERDSSIAHAQSGADGRFALEVVPPATIRLVARDAKGREGVAFASPEDAGGRTDVDIALVYAGATLSGRVVHEDGSPYRGLVAVHPAETKVVDGVTAGRVTTDEKGHFVARGLVPGPSLVTAFEPGRFASTSRVIAVPRESEFTFVMDIDLHDRKGRVVDDATGAGVPGARVVADVSEGGGRSEYTAATTTAADGSFAIRFSRGYARWIVDAPGYPHDEQTFRSPDVSKPVELRLSHGHRVVGRVVRDADGTPMGGIPVFAQRSFLDRETSTVAGADGRFVLDGLPQGRLALAAHGAGWTTKGVLAAVKGSNALSVEVGASTPDVEIRVVPAGSVRGHVVDERGSPVAAAEISTWPQNRSSEAEWIYSLASLSHAVTATDGAFRLDTMVPRIAHTITATTMDGRAVGKAIVRVDAAKESNVEIRLASGRFVEVRCETPTGAPVASATVRAWTQGGEEAESSSDTVGIARVGPLPVGGLRVDIEAPEGYAAVGEETVVANADGPDPVATFRLRPKRRVAGRVRWSDGTPARDLIVRAVAEGDEDRTEATGVDSAGSFEIEDAAADDVELRVVDPDGGSPLAARPARAGDEDVQFTLPGAAPPRMSVRVLMPDGTPCPSGSVGVTSTRYGEDGGWNAFHLSLADGATSTRLPRTPVWVRAVPEGTGGATAGVGAVTFGPVAAGTTDVIVRLPPEQSLAGVVRDASGHGLAGVAVTATPWGLPKGFDESHERRTARTDADGRFRIAALGAGQHFVTVDVPPGYEPCAGLYAESGRDDVVIEIGAPHEWTLRVVDSTGDPVVGAYVKTTIGSSERRANSDASGVAVVLGLDAERTKTVQLDVSPPENRRELAIFAESQWLTASHEVRLAPARVVRGVVRDEEGRPLVATVSVTVAGTAFGDETSASDGSFSVPHLPDGPVRLQAKSIGPARESAVVDAAAGATDVVLVAERSVALEVAIEDPSGHAVAGSVSVVERGADPEEADTDATGVARMEGLRPSGTYSVLAHVDPDGAPSLVGRVEDVRGSAGRVVVRMRAAFEIRGRVVLPSGYREVLLTASDGVETRRAVDADGSFVITGLWSGRWHVVARIRDGSGRAEADVDAGGTVVLEPKPAK